MLQQVEKGVYTVEPTKEPHIWGASAGQYHTCWYIGS